MERLPARAPAPAVGRALVAPVPLGVGVAAGGLTLLAAGVVPAVVVALVAWLVAAGARLLRRAGPRSERIDPFAVNEPWRRFVSGALQARARFDRAVDAARDGPVRDRLAELGRRVHAAVDEVWRVANQGQSLTDARRALDAPAVRRKLEGLRRDRAAAGADATLGVEDPASSGADAVDRTIASLESQLASVDRMERVIEEAQARLRLLDARLTEAVARSIELSVGVHDAGELTAIGADVDEVVLEMEALRLALEETGRQAPPAGGG